MATFRLALTVVLVFCTPVFAQLPADEFATRLVAAAMDRLSRDVTYDGSYRRIEYPNGDVPDHIGAGPELDDVLFEFPITGHYRYDGSK